MNTPLRRFLRTCIPLAAAATLLVVGCAHDREHVDAAEAKISRAEAEKIALASVPGGKIKEAELEDEDGLLIWSFDITSAGTEGVTEVHVDAKSGVIVATEHESAEHEEAEEDEENEEDHDG